MLRRALGAAVLAVALSAAGAAAGVRARSDMIVHEWGTFLAMQGSDGVTLDGMYHEEHALPPFVHARSRDQLRIPSAFVKGETPVIYFYTDRRQEVMVEVGFPAGVWTQWYPQVSMATPQLTQGGSPPELRRGRIRWNAQVIPPAEAPPLPAASADALWNFARQVDSAFVRTFDQTRGGNTPQYERFLFYRGLGSARLPLRFEPGAGSLTSEAAGPELRHLFVLRVENGRGAYRYLPSLPPGGTAAASPPPRKEMRPLAAFVPAAADALAARLEESGLHPKEARAMVNTWRSSYFETDGVRVLFILPQSWTDAFIPLRIDPEPAQVVRVMVGRLEALTPEREQRAEAAVRELGSSDPAARQRGFAWLQAQGRYVEPILRRVLRSSADERVNALCRRLLMTGQVTDLRVALRAPERSDALEDEPVNVRAQLASLLREVGLTEEARQEAESALAELGRLPRPPDHKSAARHHLRAYARASEAMGDDRQAAEWYRRLVRFGSQVVRNRGCVGCHHGAFGAAPTDVSWLRDWWAGRKLAEVLHRLGERDRAIRESEAALERDPRDAAAALTLAYLYDAAGSPDRTASIWSRLEGTSRTAAR